MMECEANERERERAFKEIYAHDTRWPRVAHATMSTDLRTEHRITGSERTTKEIPQQFPAHRADGLAR